MITSLVSMYEKGAITADHLAAQCIHMIDPEDPGLVLSDLPNPILDRMLAYAQRYQPDRMVSTYAMVPAADQVEAARSWIADLQTMREGGQTSAEADWHQYKMENRIVEILQIYRRSCKAEPILPHHLPDRHRVRAAVRARLPRDGSPTRRGRGWAACTDHLHGEPTLEADQGRENSPDRDAVPPSRRHPFLDLQV